MTRASDKENSAAEPDPEAEPIAIDSDVREGNDIAALMGSGAPMVRVRANSGVLGMSAGEVQTLLQTEELRLNVQNGNLELLETL